VTLNKTVHKITLRFNNRKLTAYTQHRPV